MATNPGEWYAEKAAEAKRIEAELADARHRVATFVVQLEIAREVVRRLERQLEQARSVGD